MGLGEVLGTPGPAQFPKPLLALGSFSIRRSVMWLRSRGPASPPEAVSGWFPAGSAYIRTCPCALWLAETPSSEHPGFWEMEIKQHFALSGNSGRPVGFCARLGAWPCREVTFLCLGRPAWGAGTFPVTCRARCLCSAVPVVLSGLRDSALRTALLPHRRGFFLQPSPTRLQERSLQERTRAAVLQVPREATASRLHP